MRERQLNVRAEASTLGEQQTGCTDRQEETNRMRRLQDVERMQVDR